jgi:hypothetical protein
MNVITNRELGNYAQALNVIAQNLLVENAGEETK